MGSGVIIIMAYFPSNYRPIIIPVPAVFISGAGADRAQVSIPFGITKWVPNNVSIYCENIGTSIATASIEIWTTGTVGNVGATLLANSPTTLSNMTAVGNFQIITGLSAPTTIYTATGILIRQNGSAGTGNATGSCYFGIEIMPLG